MGKIILAALIFLSALPLTLSIAGELTSKTLILTDITSIDYIPPKLTICRPEGELGEDIEWAVAKWREAIESAVKAYGWRELIGIDIEIVESGCFLRIETVQQPMRQGTLEAGAFILNFDRDTFRLEGGIMYLTTVDDRDTRRAVILHELGHALGLPDLDTFPPGKPLGPTPIMYSTLDPQNPPNGITFADIYLLRFIHFARKYCDITCPAYTVKIPPDPLFASLLGTVFAATISICIVFYDKIKAMATWYVQKASLPD